MKLRTAIILTITLLLITLYLENCRGCEFLVYISNKDNVLVYGDLISVYEDGHNWGSGETNSELFAIVKSTDMSVSQGLGYLMQQKLDIDTLTVPQKNTLTATKRLSLVKSKLISKLVVKEVVVEIEP